MSATSCTRRAPRALRNVTEPIAAGVYFAPEAHQGYEAQGLDYFEGYFCSRSACLGAAPWSVVCAAFAAFKPAAVEAVGHERLGEDHSGADARGARGRRHRAARAARRADAVDPADVARATEILFAGERRRRPVRAGALRRASRSSTGRPRRSARCGAPPTSCASTAATVTSRRGCRTSTPPRSR